MRGAWLLRGASLSPFGVTWLYRLCPSLPLPFLEHPHQYHAPGDDKPQDVYMRIVDRVNVVLEQHAKGNFDCVRHPGKTLSKLKDEAVVAELAQNILAQGPVARKTVKQTIMTSVYGVTFIGARDQVLKQLKAKNMPMDDQEMNLASSYLVACVFACLDEMFQQAHSIKDWLSNSAWKVAASGSPVGWITPMGMPVIQPYHKERSGQVETKFRKLIVKRTNDFRSPPNASKQKSAFPPNYVHSLDSTHMLYTANACAREGTQCQLQSRPCAALYATCWC